MAEQRPRAEAGRPWTQLEIEAAVAAYAEMLDAERRGERYSKAAFNRRVDAMIGRGHGSIERKIQNISAVLWDEGLPWIDGYKPLSNVQFQLRSTVLDLLGPGRRIAEALETYADTPLAAPQPRRLATEDVIVNHPGRVLIDERRPSGSWAGHSTRCTTSSGASSVAQARSGSSSSSANSFGGLDALISATGSNGSLDARGRRRLRHRELPSRRRIPTDRSENHQLRIEDSVLYHPLGD